VGLFATKAARAPVAETEGANLLNALSGVQPLAAVQQVVKWLRELAAAEVMPAMHRETVVRQLDDAAQPHARFLSREYLTMAHLSAEEELKLWRANRDFWAQLGAAYHTCVTEAGRAGEVRDPLRRIELARLVVRLMRAYAARVKWDQFRYWPASEAVWQIMGHAYLFAYENGFARREVSAYHGERQPSTVEQEYLKALVFQISSTDSLLPFEIEIAERLIGVFQPFFALSDRPAPDYAYSVDPNERRAPKRASEQTQHRPTLRYFGTADAVEPLEELQQSLEQGSVPARAGLARYRSPRILLPVVRHLAGYWSARPPKREHDRHRVRTQIGVISGLKQIAAALAQAEEAPRFAIWFAENVSQGGFRLRFPLSDRDTLHVGTLLGIRPEGGDNWLVGVVRRFMREGGEAGAAGVQTLSKHPLAVEMGSDNEQYTGLLLDAPDEGEVVRVIVPGSAFRPNESVPCTIAGARMTLTPIEVVERGIEFEIGGYRVQDST